MAAFDSLRRKLHLRLLAQQVRQHPYPHHSVRYDEARSFGILFDGAELNHRNAVLGLTDRLRKAGKTVRLLAYMDNAAEGDNFPFDAFNKKNIDWLYRPKGDAVASFLNHPVDILLNLSLKENPALEYIAALAKAHYRVGVFANATHCYELMIDLPASRQLPDLIKQIEFFLQKMQSTHDAAKV
jgi:hypothetical protein